jgi:phage/plasmid-associated DNA primase
LKENMLRAGRPEDYISKCMPIMYGNYTDDSDEVHEVHSFFEKVFPDKDLRTYFLDKTCDVFVGGNFDKIALFFVGSGDNAKSVTQSFFEQMLGPLAIKMNTCVLTGKKPQMGAANPDLTRAGGGVRWVVFEEPDGDEEINSGGFKFYTGNDNIYARELFQRGCDGREYKPLFKVIFICNKLPKFRYPDQATFNRVRVIPFESTFCRGNTIENTAPLEYSEQLRQKRFPMDPNFSRKIPSLISALAWVLLEHRKKPRSGIEPEKVRMATMQYKQQNDIYLQFSNECIADAPSGRFVSRKDIFERFKSWFREGFPGTKIPGKNEICDYFINKWGEGFAGKWEGHMLKLEDTGADCGGGAEEEFNGPPI